MYVSPPLTILAILAVGLAGTTWFAPLEHGPARVALSLSTATYDKLASWGREQAGADGRPLSVEQVIEELARRPVNEMGTR